MPSELKRLEEQLERQNAFSDWSDKWIFRVLAGVGFVGGTLLSVNPTGTIAFDSQVSFAVVTILLGIVLIRCIRRGVII